MRVSTELRSWFAAVAIIGASVSASSSVQAALIDAQVPTNAFITVGELDWAWGAPVTTGFTGGSGIDLSFQSAFGWRIPTAPELVNAPNAVDFLVPGGNVPFAIGGGTDPISSALFDVVDPGNYDAAVSDAACATPYFNTLFNMCDWRDGRGEPFGRDWAGTPGTEQFYEQLFVRTVPEPSTFLLLTFGLICLTARRRTH